MRNINYRYNTGYEEVRDFEFVNKNEIVSYKGYEQLLPRIVECANSIEINPATRQAIATLNRSDNMSCLISIQFLNLQDNLYVIANFRSQHAELGRSHDTELLRYFVTVFLKECCLDFNSVEMTVNVADYHGF